MTEHVAYIGLGSNLENPLDQLRRAFADLAKLPGTSLIARSSLYRSAPLGCSEQPDIAEQPDFVNAVAKIATGLSPQVLLQALLHIEHQHGRERTFRNAPRTLDLDVLLYDGVRLHEHGLTIPHPQMHLRAFVLQPLLEIVPDIDIPGVGRASLALAGCHDQVLERLPDAV
ncbi:MAG: 2-amino-4-hydroxy-6-hydroxymethyldihydropteridine diphosphokinase [Nitrosomonadales bacterium]|nr:2-amino-4-hydroxy-6-hydroxymethyldihydropteridine diphosphokinase [Nitrosomonadales bacterium]